MEKLHNKIVAKLEVKFKKESDIRYPKGDLYRIDRSELTCKSPGKFF